MRLHVYLSILVQAYATAGTYRPSREATGSSDRKDAYRTVLYPWLSSLLSALYLREKSLSVVKPVDELEFDAFKFDAFLTRPLGSIRFSILHVHTNKTNQSFPVVFDTGSDSAWLISDRFGKSLARPRDGYRSETERRGFLAMFDFGIEYIDSKTSCSKWVEEIFTLTSESSSWASPLCVADHTDIDIRAFSGVIGADLNSALVRTHQVFWMVPQENDRVGLAIGDRLNDGWFCSTPMRFVPLTFYFSNAWKVNSEIAIGSNDPVALPARLDTGAIRIYLPLLLWNQFRDALVEKGINLVKKVHAGDYSATKCDRVEELPVIKVKFGEFAYDLSSREYVEILPEKGTCVFHIYELPDEMSVEALIGAPLLTRVVTKWDSYKKNVGFCEPTTYQNRH